MRDTEEWSMVFWRASTGSIVQTIDICIEIPRGFILLACVPVIDWPLEEAA